MVKVVSEVQVTALRRTTLAHAMPTVLDTVIMVQQTIPIEKVVHVSLVTVVNHRHAFLILIHTNLHQPMISTKIHRRNSDVNQLQSVQRLSHKTDILQRRLIHRNQTGMKKIILHQIRIVEVVINNNIVMGMVHQIRNNYSPIHHHFINKLPE